MFHRRCSVNVFRNRIPNCLKKWMSYEIVQCWVLVYKAENWTMILGILNESQM